MTLEKIKSQFTDVALKLGENRSCGAIALSLYPDFFHTTGDDNGGVYYEFHSGKYFQTATERGVETFRVETDDPNEVLSWLVKPLVSAIAREWELKNRIPHQDSRKLKYEKQIELLRSISEKWANEEEARFAIMIFDDAGIDRHH